ncbi:MAG: hypothetical protein RLO81_04195 [Fulvivirga sp.]|uniref:hypothetical protein n=1 Tax=Fulvivirga sp. TaxID=1931237 RepID=UPI0032ECC702
MFRLTKCIVIVFLLILVADEAFAQKRKRPTATSHHRGRFKPINISRAKASVVCPVFEDSQYPYHGIGIKVGDPFALTYKFYANKNFSVVIDGGKTASGLYSKYYRENFDTITQPDTLLQDQSVEYLGHVVDKDLVFEGKLLYQRDASKLLKGLQWYVGAGVQYRDTEIQYEYLVEVSFDRTEIDTFDEAFTSLGPTAVIGIEYSYFTIPIAAFMEIEWYTDVVNDPGWQRFQGGVGLRLVF